MIKLRHGGSGIAFLSIWYLEFKIFIFEEVRLES
jgi:hypothetical protein